MAEFTEVIEQRERMCKHFRNIIKCNSCPIDIDNNGYKIGCAQFILNHPKEADEIIMNWAKEHPIKTNADKFKEVFGFEPCKTCIMHFGLRCGDCKYGGMHGCAKVWWNEEYKEPRGVKNE